MHEIKTIFYMHGKNPFPKTPPRDFTATCCHRTHNYKLRGWEAVSNLIWPLKNAVVRKSWHPATSAKYHFSKLPCCPCQFNSIQEIPLLYVEKPSHLTTYYIVLYCSEHASCTVINCNQMWYLYWLRCSVTYMLRMCQKQISFRSWKKVATWENFNFPFFYVKLNTKNCIEILNDATSIQVFEYVEFFINSFAPITNV